MWFDAADSSTFTPTNPSNGQTVTQWRDKSSNSNHLVQATAGTVTSSGTYSTTGYNGKPAVFMNPTGVSAYGIYSTQAMWSSNTINFQRFFPSNDTNTFFMVFSQTGGIVGAMSLQWTSTGSGNSHVVQDFGSGNLCASGPGINSNIPSGMGANLMITWVTRGLSSTSESYDLYIYGAPNGNLTYLNTSDSGYTWNFNERFVIGAKDSNAAYYGIGYHAEYIMYNQALTTSQRQQVEGYLAWKWGIESIPQPPTIPGVVPSSISGLSLWLDGADPNANGTKPANGANVTTWVDKSSNGYSPVASAGAYPTYTLASNCITWNGGANTQLIFPTGISNAVVGRAFTIFVVDQRTTASENFILRGTTTANNSNLLLGWGSGSPTTTRRFAFYGNDLDCGSLTAYAAGEAPTFGCYQYSKPNRAIYHLGQAVAGASDTNATDLASWTGAMIGGGTGSWLGYYGSVFELLIYNRAVTATERQEVESYLSTKWGIPMTTNGYTPLLNSPGNIPGCMLWLDATDTSTVNSGGIIPSGTAVTTWRDKSGQNNTATGYNSPTLIKNGINSADAMYLANSAGGGSIATGIAFRGSFSNGLTGTTVTAFAVSTLSAYTNTRDQRLISVSSNTSSYDYNSANAFILDVQAINPGNFISYRNGMIGSNTLAPLARPFLASTVYTGANGYLWVDGVPASTTGTASSGSFASYVYGIGGDSFSAVSGATGESWYGYIGEVLIFSNALSTAQRQSVESYLSLKWGLSNIYTSIPGSIAGLSVWLDGSDPAGTSVPPASGASVSTWVDKSGNGYNATVASGKTAGTFSVASNCVYFPASTTGYVTSYPANPKNETMFVVFNNPSPSSANNILIGGQLGARSLGAGYSGSVGVGAVGNLNNEVAWLASTAASYTSGTTVIVASQFTTTSNGVALNGRAYSTGGSPAFSNSTTTYLGVDTTTSAYYYIGYAMEIIFYNNILSATQRQAVESYLARKWKIVIPRQVLPTSHPFTTIQPSLRTFNPVDVGVDIALWLDAADASTIQLSGASNIVSWTDKSPNAYLLSNTTTASQPTYVTSGLNKSYPCVRVNGSTSGTQFLTTPLFTGFNGTTWDVYVVVRIAGGQNALIWFDPSDRILILSALAGGNSANAIHWGSGGSGTWKLAPGVGEPSIQNACIAQFYSTGSVVGRRLNGVYPGDVRTQTASQAYSTLSTARPFYLCNPSGGWSTGDSYIGEMLIFSNVLTDNQRLRVEGYLSAKWGLGTSHIPTGFSPTSISGCQLWFDASDTSSITPSSITNGTKVSQWNDKSGNARHMSNATSASQPTYSTCNVAGTLPSVYFTGSADASTNGNILSNSASTVFNSTTWDMYAVFKPSSQYQETAIFWNDPSVAVVLICGSSSISPTYSVHYGGWRLSPTDGACRGNEVQVYQVYSTGTTLGRRVNGAFEGTTAQTASYSWPSRSSNSELAFTRPSTGTWTSGNTSLCEIIVYNTVLSDANRSNVESYLTNKWYVGTGVQLGNPFYYFPPSAALPWQPTSITGCFLWLDAADKRSMVISSGSNVGTWLDKSGNGYNAASLDTAATVVDSSFGGNTSLLFNGASRYLCTTAAISNSGYTIFTVQNTTSQYGGGSASGYQRAINANNYVFVGVSNGHVATFTGSGSGWNDTASNSPAFYSVNTNVLVSMSVSNSVLTPYFNGIAGTTKTGTTGAFSNFYIGNEPGGVQPWYGNISEIIVYNGILTTSQRQQVEGYLSWKWGLISSAAPSDSMKLLFWADQCTATATSLSAIATYGSVFINKLALPGGPVDTYVGTTLTLPYTGAYLIEISGWRCGAGTGQAKVVGTRDGTTVYQRIRGVAQADCCIWIAQFYWNLFRAGDVVTLYKSDNYGGTAIGTTTSQNSASDDARGPVKIWFIQ